MEATYRTHLLAVCERLETAARASGRVAAQVKLIAVSKGQSQAAVETLMALGQRTFGENRVQEAEAKFKGLIQRNQLELHLIGPLQTNKAKQAVELFDVIETLDRPELALALHKAMVSSGKTPRLLVQVNIGREPQKAGIDPDALAALLTYIEELGLPTAGLMAIPPLGADPVPHFRQLADLAAKHGLKELSMGMSGDFEAAIACGATYIRVGTALFGAR